MPELETYLLGVGFKLREEYHQYRSFFEKIVPILSDLAKR